LEERVRNSAIDLDVRPPGVQPLRPRSLGTSPVDGWQIKTYGVASEGVPRAELTRAARTCAAATLPERPDLEGAFGVGFLIVRDGIDGCLALVDWWAHDEQLYQRAFTAPADRPRELEPLATAGIGGVCELAVVAHERIAWLRHVLANPAGRDIDGYLRDTFCDAP
jgi:hypothetical protein